MNIRALSRFKNKKWLGKDKANVVICGLYPYFPSEQVKCEECKVTCYFTGDNLDLIKKKHKKICTKCALEKHSKELNEEQKIILKKALENQIEKLRKDFRLIQ